MLIQLLSCTDSANCTVWRLLDVWVHILLHVQNFWKSWMLIVPSLAKKTKICHFCCCIFFQARIHISSKQNLQYGWLAYMLGDRATKRFTENSKIFTVEGNLSSGKGKLAKQIAEKLGTSFPISAIVTRIWRCNCDYFIKIVHQTSNSWPANC